MALLEMKLRSETLGLTTSVNVIMPQLRTNDKKLKVLWLLHGMSGDHTGWCRNTSIERYVENKQLCVIMPAVDLSFYTDMVYGNKYFTYITKELPKILISMLNISTKRDDNYVAGLSMGGYGAFKIGLNYPDKYCMVASLSGAVDRLVIYDNQYEHYEEIMHQYTLIFGDKSMFEGSINDLKHMVKVRSKEDNLPEMYMCCGTQDFLFQNNQLYYEYLKSLNIPLTYKEDAGYDHTWEYWDMKIQKVLEWMKL